MAKGEIDLLELARDRAHALTLTPVSRETADRLDRFIALLLERNQHINLIASSTSQRVWTRHVADSLQLLNLAEGRIWADFGSGAGFPGLALACALAPRPGHVVHLIESREKKAAFLREAARLVEAPAIIHATRIEEITSRLPAIDVVTARAVAPLPKLLAYAYPLVKKGAKALLMKGQDIELELTQASKYWKIEAELVTSKTDPASRIIIVSDLAPR